MNKKMEPRAKDKDSFEAVAKRLECDDDKARFEAKLGKLTKAGPNGKVASKENRRIWAKLDKGPQR